MLLRISPNGDIFFTSENCDWTLEIYANLVICHVVLLPLVKISYMYGLSSQNVHLPWNIFIIPGICKDYQPSQNVACISLFINMQIKWPEHKRKQPATVQYARGKSKDTIARYTWAAVILQCMKNLCYNMISKSNNTFNGLRLYWSCLETQVHVGFQSKCAIKMLEIIYQNKFTWVSQPWFSDDQDLLNKISEICFCTCDDNLFWIETQANTSTSIKLVSDCFHTRAKCTIWIIIRMMVFWTMCTPNYIAIRHLKCAIQMTVRRCFPLPHLSNHAAKSLYECLDL